MTDEPRRRGPTRRRFLTTTALGAGAAVGFPGRGEPQSSSVASLPAELPAGSSDIESDGALFSEAERKALSALADLVLPGAGAWGATAYIERTLTLFDNDPPRLYAGTVGSTDEWLPFDRVREHAWRLRIFGSKVVDHPNEAIVGPVPGYRPAIAEGARLAAARVAEGASPNSIWGQLSDDFHEIFTVLVLEGSLGDPIYGGNREGAAWRAFHFGGSMLGYGTYWPHADVPGEVDREGPDPLGFFTRTALWIMGFFSRRIA